MSNITTLSNTITTVAQAMQNSKINQEEEENKEFKLTKYIKENDGFTVNSSSLGCSNTDIADAYKRQASGYSNVRDGSLATEEAVFNPKDYLTTFYDEMSGETFEISLLPPNNVLAISKEESERLGAIYPPGSEVFEFKLAEMSGRAKIIDGVPVKYVEVSPKGFCVNVYDIDFNLIQEYNVSTDSTVMNYDLFFKKLVDFEKSDDMKNSDTWEKFLESL